MNETPRILSDVVPQTKSSLMEITAVTSALEAAPRKSVILLKTDCQTVCDAAATRGTRFINRKDGHVYRRFYRAINRHHLVEFLKVKAHTGDPDNEAVDQLAKTAIREGAARLNIPVPANFGLLPKGRPLAQLAQ